MTKRLLLYYSKQKVITVVNKLIFYIIMNKYIIYGWLLLLISTAQTYAQRSGGYWQQQVDYKMEIDFDATTHRFTGKQKIVYTNNSPDELTQVFYHLYFNAFQPGSMMDVRSRTIKDPDGRVTDRIFYLKPNEIGYQKIKSLKQDGKALTYKVEGTILEVKLNKAIQPGKKTTFEMEFEGQVPKQIRRSGRDNREGVAYSMTQWYPKLAEYDHQGWHANPYVGREFHGVWGDFDVKITMDSSYVIAASGYLQNPEKIGHGYTTKKVKRDKGAKLTWHFKAPNVHDFAWAADKEYIHDTAPGPHGVTLHFFYKKSLADRYKSTWKKLPDYTAKAMAYVGKNFGQYPYKQYSVIQGGDGGMEYAMATLITGKRQLGSLVGVTVHEMVHSWYQMVLGTNESLYSWMDEGFNTYVTNLTMQHLFRGSVKLNPSGYRSYRRLVESGKEEALSTHADHFNTNLAYGAAAYTKGSIFVNQLNYIIGEENTAKGMLEYFNAWKFKHPTDIDFVRVMEKVSGLELDWYREYWVLSTHTIDYGIKTVQDKGDKTEVVLERIGKMPMPIEVVVTYNDGSKEKYYMPLRIMRGEKPQGDKNMKRTIKPDWPWTFPTYSLTIDRKRGDIAKIEIDPSLLMADIDRKNNVYPKKIDSQTTFPSDKK
ncbi:putative aminopeptidase [Microscilla marina ATCC 23134]|uniref:Putative aminopeptidase n=2 Tax=Microscilla marina TaxID=1027 RepID=A1ZYN4_MICM2|nr:putative aminopeptidase [Microscilla marina ATCC 23134]